MRTVVPNADQFEEGDYLDAPELRDLANKLMAQDADLQWLATVEITYLWKKKGGKNRGRIRLAQVQKTPKLMRHFVTTEFVIWAAAEELTGLAISSVQLERIVFHELCHFHRDEESGKAQIFGHDLEYFYRELDRYGLAVIEGRSPQENTEGGLSD